MLKRSVSCILVALNLANAHLELLLFHQSPPLNAFGGDWVLIHMHWLITSLLMGWNSAHFNGWRLDLLINVLAILHRRLC